MIVGPRHGPVLPRELSRSSDKLDLYAADTFFTESWEDLVEVAGDEALPVAGVMAALTLKPDAIVTRVGHRALRWLETEGFSVIAAERVMFDRRMTHDVWRYAWNVATRERKAVMELLMCSAPTVFIALRGPAPAALRLSRRKGPADPSRRSPGELRDVLRARVPLLNFVHTADEAADVIREIGVYFNADTRRAIYRAALAPQIDFSEVEALLSGVEDAAPYHDLELEPAVHRVLRQLDDIGGHGPDRTGELRRDLARVLEGAQVDARTLAQLLDGLRPPCSRWDRIVIASHVAPLETGTAEPLVPRSPPAEQGNSTTVEMSWSTPGRPVRFSKAQRLAADFLTACNLASGIAAVLHAGGGLPARRSTLILVAAACDAFDGPLARRSGTPSELGAACDGVADLVSFGVAPARLLATCTLESRTPLSAVAPGFYLAAAAWRLARYGLGPRTSHVFRGLPIPGAGILVAMSSRAQLSPRGSTYLAVGLAGAMVSHVPVLSGEALLRRTFGSAAPRMADRRRSPR